MTKSVNTTISNVESIISVVQIGTLLFSFFGTKREANIKDQRHREKLISNTRTKIKGMTELAFFYLN